MFRSRSRSRMLIYVFSEFQFEIIQEVIKGFEGPLSITVAGLGIGSQIDPIDRHHRTVEKIYTWALKQPKVVSVKLMNFHSSKFGWLRNGLKLFMLHPHTVIFGNFFSIRTVLSLWLARPTRWIVVDDGLYSAKLVGYRSRDGLAKEGPLQSGTPLAIESRHHRVWARATFLLRRLPFEYYSAFPLEPREPQIAHQLASWPNCTLNMSSWVLVIGSYVPQPGALVPQCLMRRAQIAIAQSLFPNSKLVYLLHPGEPSEHMGSLETDFPHVEVVGPLDSWRQLMQAKGSLPLATVSYVSTLDYLIHQARSDFRPIHWIVQPHRTWISDFEYSNWSSNAQVLRDLIGPDCLREICASAL